LCFISATPKTQSGRFPSKGTVKYSLTFDARCALGLAGLSLSLGTTQDDNSKSRKINNERHINPFSVGVDGYMGYEIPAQDKSR
jgi:hypothetical protein